MNNREELAWAAGFFDGEGHTRSGRAMGLTISQADRPELLERFRRAVGVGVVYGPYVHRARPKQRPFYVYNVASFELTQHCICCLWHWLGSAKRTQAANALHRWRTKPRKWFKADGRSRLICIRGHRVEGANVYLTKSGYTACRECRKHWGRNAKNQTRY